MINVNRLKWRSKRSILELDLYFSRFVEAGGIEYLTADELKLYAEILELEDTDLLLLFQGVEKLHNGAQQNVIEKIVNVGVF